VKKKVTIEFIFDDENFDLDAITHEFILETLKEAGLIDEDDKPDWKIKIELIDENDDDEAYDELYNRIITEREKLELERLKRHEKLQRLIHKRQSYKAYVI